MTTLFSILLIKVLNSETQQKVINDLITNDFLDPFTEIISDSIDTFSTKFSFPTNLEIKDITIDLPSVSWGGLEESPPRYEPAGRARGQVSDSLKISSLYSHKDTLTYFIDSAYHYLNNISTPGILKVYMLCCGVVVVTAVTIKTIYFIHNVYLTFVTPFVGLYQMIGTTADITKQVVMYTADTSKQVVLYTADTFKAGFIKTRGFLFDMSKIVLKIIFNHLI
jgi:hypothetical protein